MAKWDDHAPSPISTHAPAGGATGTTIIAFFGLMKFLLTPLREGRPGSFSASDLYLPFLLTPLREGRHFPDRK